MKAASACLLCFFTITYAAVLPGPQSRISGGAVSSISQYPFAAALLTNHGAGSIFTQACGGSILTTSSLLSAASCFNDEGTFHTVYRWRARVGSSFANSGGSSHLIRLITPHPDYTWSDGDSDLAILRFTIPVSYGPSIGPASIAGVSYSLETNQRVSAIGWGLVSVSAGPAVELRTVDGFFFIINQETCRNRYAEAGFTVTDNMVCAGWLDVGVYAQCNGDAGSPLLHEGVVVGVYSWTAGACAEGWFPGLNTRVSHYTQWILVTANA